MNYMHQNDYNMKIFGVVINSSKLVFFTSYPAFVVNYASQDKIFDYYEIEYNSDTMNLIFKILLPENLC